MNITLGGLKNSIKESYSENVISDEFEFEGVVHSLPTRSEEDILRLLPYVMSQSLNLIESGGIGKLQVLEIAIRLFNGLSKRPSMRSSAGKIRSLLSPAQRICIANWFFVFKRIGLH